MRVLVPKRVTDKLQQELKAAQQCEIGGVLVAEHLGSDQFRLVDLSVQRQGGNSDQFVRDPDQHRAFLADFFDRSGYDFTRCNYFGEWHSHTNVTAIPSATDLMTMQEIVADPEVGVSFAVLLVARWRPWWGLDLSAAVFQPLELPRTAELLPDSEDKGGRTFQQIKPRPPRQFIRV